METQTAQRPLWKRVLGIGRLNQRPPKQLPARAPRGRQFKFDRTIDRHQVNKGGVGRHIEAIIAAYERAEDGDIEDMVDLFEKRIESDAHLRGALNNRNEAVTQKPWTIEAGGAAEGQTDADRFSARELERRLRLIPLNFMDALEHQMEFQSNGWAGTELTWGMVEGLASPTFFDNIAHRRFRFESETDRFMLRTIAKPAFGEPLREGKWWTTCRRGRLIATSGLMRTALWWSTFKMLSARDWLVLANRFGIPYVTGQFEDDIADEDKDELLNAIQNIGTDGYAMFSKAAEIMIHQMQTKEDSNQGIHGALVGVCDNQISKLIEGATLVSQVDGPGSHALGKVHEDKYFDILLGDAEKLAASFEMNVGLPFVRYNGIDARPPRLKMHLGLNLGLPTLIDIGLKLANGVEGFDLSEDQLRQMTLFRKPSDDDALRGIEAAKIDAQAEQSERQDNVQPDPNS